MQNIKTFLESMIGLGNIIWFILQPGKAKNDCILLLFVWL